jgi:hypothetical protein
MANLLIKNGELQGRVIALKLGVNRLGRAPKNDIVVEHPTVSARHCEIEVGEREIVIRDCGSTNGTFAAGHRIQEARVPQGQTFYAGDVLFLVESTEMTVAIPKFDVPDQRPKPPVVLPSGALVCPRHPEAIASHQCTHCFEVMCAECAHQLRREGGRLHYLCPKCSFPCIPLCGRPKKKKSLLAKVASTVKQSITRATGVRRRG